MRVPLYIFRPPLRASNINNPLIFNLDNNYIASANIELDLSKEQSITYKWTSRTNTTEEWTCPSNVKVVRVNFTWHYGSDERGRLNGGIRYGPGNGCGIRNSENKINWFYTDRDAYVGVTPNKTYKFNVWVDGYKGRDYGFTLSWSNKINAYTPTIEDY